MTRSDAPGTPRQYSETPPVQADGRSPGRLHSDRLAARDGASTFIRPYGTATEGPFGPTLHKWRYFVESSKTYPPAVQQRSAILWVELAAKGYMELLYGELAVVLLPIHVRPSRVASIRDCPVQGKHKDSRRQKLAAAQGVCLFQGSPRRIVKRRLSNQ